MSTEVRISGPRLKQARKDAGLSQAALGERVGLSQQSVADLENGKTMETTKLLALARACNVSPEYLLGREEAQPLKSRTTRKPVYASADLRTLPEIDLRAGAAYGGGQIDMEWNEDGLSGHEPVAQWGLPPSFVERELGLSYDLADVIQIRGDSMDDGTAKGLASGDRAIVDRQDTDPRQGGIFAVFDGEGVIIKQVELLRGHNPPRIVCKSKNPAYDPIPLTLEEPVRIIGRIAGKVSRM